MKLPTTKELSDEQMNLYMEAPIDGITLVKGPPGTGKTVMAYLRSQVIATVLAKRNEKLSIIMYNRVLKRYTSNANDGKHSDSIDVSTFHAWVFNWWSTSGLPEVPSDKLILHVPFAEKDQVKKLGAKWFEWHKKKKHWWIGSDEYEKNKGKWSGWRPRHLTTIKHLDGNKYELDYKSMATDVVRYRENLVPWNHLLIDEGQDFPPEMYRMLFCAHAALESDACVTIFADENQRLNESNSTIKDIERNAIPTYQFELTINFRNTLQIAKLAQHFYTGLSTGKPRLPTRKGEKPRLIGFPKHDDLVEYLGRFIRNNSTLNVGILCQGDRQRTPVCSALKKELGSSRIVQTYTSKKSSGSESLDFFSSGTVTVVNKQSAKGLEFDAVFLIGLESTNLDDHQPEQIQMELYVLVSRARNRLEVLYVKGRGVPGFMKLFPKSDDDIIEHSIHE